MAGQSIIPVNPELIQKVDTPQGLGDLIKPLTREIHLFDSFIAGTSYLKDPEVLKKAAVGDTLTLRRESANRFDSNAILILNADGEKYGYVPEKDNQIFARLMDAGKQLTAKVVRKELEEHWLNIRIAIDMKEV